MSLKIVGAAVFYAAVFVALLLAVDVSWSDVKQLWTRAAEHEAQGWYAVPDDSPQGRMTLTSLGDGAFRVRGSGLRAWGALLVAPRSALTLYDMCPLEAPHTHDAAPEAAEVALAFEARQASEREQAHVIVSAGDRYTEEQGGVCTKCADAFATAIDVPREWHGYVIVLSQLRQEGWGRPARERVDVASLRHVALRFRVGEDFDLSLRDLRLVRAPAASP